MAPFVLSQRTMKVTDLAPELLLKILESLPDAESLKNAVLSSKSIYNVFVNYQSSVTKSVLMNEISVETYTHAIVNQQLLSGQVALPALDVVDINDIADHVDGVRQRRDGASSARLTLKDALSISHTETKVTNLCHRLIGDCDITGRDRFVPLWFSLRACEPLPSELARIKQAIYLYQILVQLCRNWYFLEVRDREYLVNCQDKVTELQKCLTERLMAPWELHQVIAVQAYFRRALHGSEPQRHVSERIMPGHLVMGVDFFHFVLSTLGAQNAGTFVKAMDQVSRAKPPHAIGMVLSRGVNDAWTRQEPKPFEEYKSFWEGDRLGYESWTLLEKHHLRYFKSNPVWDDFFREDRRNLEGKLDVWGAALWNPSRWPAMDATLGRNDGQLWSRTRWHWDPIVVGFEAIMFPDDLV